LVSWIGARGDTYLLSWAVGMGLVVLGVVLFSVPGAPYDSMLQLGAFVLLVSGFTAIYVGAHQFHLGTVSLPTAFWVWGSFTGAIALPFARVYSGVGTRLANFGIPVLTLMASRHYWAGRA